MAYCCFNACGNRRVCSGLRSPSDVEVRCSIGISSGAWSAASTVGMPFFRRKDLFALLSMLLARVGECWPMFWLSGKVKEVSVVFCMSGKSANSVL